MGKEGREPEETCLIKVKISSDVERLMQRVITSGFDCEWKLIRSIRYILDSR